MRKKKPQQTDTEKLQALLKSWDIQLPEKKNDFPETSLDDFPKSDFPESPSKNPPKPDPPAQKINLKKDIPNEKINLKKDIPDEKPKLKKDIPINAFFDQHKKKPVTPESILNKNPDLDKLFKKQIIQHLHGTIRKITPANLLLPVFLVFYGITAMNGIRAVISFLCFFGAFFYTWHIFRWKLTFNGETNRFSYCSLFREEIHFHASEIQSCKIEEHYSRAGFRKAIILSVYHEKITIILGYLHKQEYTGGYPNAEKLLEYLNFYQELNGQFSHSGRIAQTSTPDSSAKQELMDLLTKYQNQIDQKNKE